MCPVLSSTPNLDSLNHSVNNFVLPSLFILKFCKSTEQMEEEYNEHLFILHLYSSVVDNPSHWLDTDLVSSLDKSLYQRPGSGGGRIQRGTG